MRYLLRIVMCIGFLFWSCKFSVDIKQDDKAIITLLYNKESSKLPPPKANIKINLEKYKKYDTDKKIIENEYAISSIGNEDISMHIDKVCNLLECPSETSSKLSPIDIESMNLKDLKNDRIITISSDGISDIKKIKELYGVLGVIGFSSIIYNDTDDEAIIFVSVFRHGLDSNFKAYKLKKTNDGWEIIKSKTISFS